MSSELSVEIICIGTELLNGLVQDTNSHWLAKEASLLGCDMRRVTIVPDDREQMLEAFHAPVARGTNVVLTSGGLGPTADDMTVQIMAEYLRVPVVIDEGIVQAQMARRGITDRKAVPPGPLTMSKKPESAIAHPNPVGAAPCIEVRHGTTTFFIMPGPPREVQGVFEAYVKPHILNVSPFKTAHKRVIVNMPESQVGPLMVQVMKAHPGTYLKAAIATSQRVGDLMFLPVDVVSKGDSLEHATTTLGHTLGLFEELVQKAGSQFASRMPEAG